MTEKQISSIPVSYLATIPEAREIILEHLEPTYPYHDLETRLGFMGSLREMFDLNMGGGIPHDVIVALMAELDALDIAPRAS